MAKFQEMGELSAQMVEAARAQDWERLVSLEKAVARLRDALTADDTTLDPQERGMKAALIQRILDDDAEIRRHTEPWMEHVRGLLGGMVSQRRVEQAYSAGQL